MEREERFNPLFILNFATFFQYQRFVMPISFLFYLQNGLTFSQFIFCQSIYNAACLLAKMLFGFVGDIFSKKYILIFSYFLFLLRVILWINFSGFWILLVGEILYGLFKAFYKGNIDSYIYEYLQTKSQKDDMIKKYGKLSFYTSCGSAISCFVGVILYKYYGFKTILYLELITQILAIGSLFMLPNLKRSDENKKCRPIEYLKTVVNSIISVFKNAKVNYYIFYSSYLSGLTNVFVWNFQPLLKLSGAPVFLYGLLNFINQMLRAVGGLSAKYFSQNFDKTKMIVAEYVALILSFGLLISGHIVKNYVFSFVALLIICFAILLFVIFNIFTVSKIHQYSQDYNRATRASVNTFAEDFMSVFLLLGFKFLYDKLGFSYAIVVFALITIILMLPQKTRINNAG